MCAYDGKIWVPNLHAREGIVEVSDVQEAEQDQMPCVMQHEQTHQCDALQN